MIGAGFYVNRKWQNSKCRPATRDISKCLRGRPFLAYGDSNSRSFINYIVNLLNLTIITKQKSEKYTEYFLANDTYNDISISWQPHALLWLTTKVSENKNFIPTDLTISQPTIIQLCLFIFGLTGPKVVLQISNLK